MKKIICLFALLGAAPASAADLPGNFTANATLSSDYVFRGISQSDEHPALQGSVDWSYEPLGVYAGSWASTVDLPDAAVEIDFYGGINGIKNDFTWDLGAIYYAYPGAADSLEYDYFELAVAMGYDFHLFSLSTALNYSPDYFGYADDSLYPAAYVSVPLPYGLTASGSLGYLWTDNTFGGVEDYADWSLGLNAVIKGFDAGVKYQNTTLDDPQDCDRGCDSRVVLSFGKTF